MKHLWKLMKDGEIIGVLTETDVDMPFTGCKFVPHPAFSLYQAKFAEGLSLLNSEKMNDWERVYSEILALGFTLVPDGVNSEVITEFILHIDGDKAWFRS